MPPESIVAASEMPFGLFDTPVLIWLGIAVLLIGSSIVLDSRFPVLPNLEKTRQEYLMYLLKLCTGLSLLMSAYNDVIFAPHLMAENGLGNIFLLVEVVIGILLILNFHIFAATILLFLLCLGVAFTFGALVALEYLNMTGIACCLLLFNFHPEKYRVHLKAYSIASLRILTGIALVSLGLSEKLLNPDLGEFFVAQYQWNFMLNLGFTDFSNELFVFCAGMMEVIFGIILIIGTTTRVNILVVSAFMFTSNITFFASGNYSEALLEIFGHLPFIATAMILIFFGSGNKLKITSLWKHQPADLTKFE
ncbi:MAG: DoxX family membrane protein [Gammaproteobacteria bacterium]|nr:DoxX family membrane protein [Gammaproteobacteria bacterium]